MGRLDVDGVVLSRCLLYRAATWAKVEDCSVVIQVGRCSVDD